MKTSRFYKLARYIEISQEIKNAFEIKRPIVALESAIITHGMPHPYNVDTALEVEHIVREQGAAPATIGIINGKLKIGLTPQEIQYLASSENVVKTSKRDIPYVLSKHLNGGTTVAGTMLAANYVGIRVFVTGGIGGVHRLGEQTMDISADLIELGRTPIAVVCSGIKSILDIGRSLEYLETQGVCVATYGDTKQFPAFYCRSSQHMSPYNVNSPDEAASLIQAITDLQLQTGVIIAVPIPKKDELVDGKTMEDSISNALKLAESAKVRGKEVTPFILKQLVDLTEGRSLRSNIALIKNNAFVGAKIAVTLSVRTSGTESHAEGKEERSKKQYVMSETVYAKPRPEGLHTVVVGGSMLDSVASVKEPFKVEESTLRGRIQQSGGGVGRNLADALGKLSGNPLLVSAVGDDIYGQYILHNTLNHLDHSAVLVSKDLPTASYSVLLDNKGAFRMGVGDMDIHSLITPDHIIKHLSNVSTVVMDGNIPAVSVAFILDYCSNFGIPVVFEPTDVAKAAIPFQFESWKCLRLITPNVKELRKIASFIGVGVGTSDSTSIEEAAIMATPLAEYIQTVMVTLGALGVLMVGRERTDGPVTSRHYSCTPLGSVASASGAGDCLAAAVIKGLLAGEEEPVCVSAGFAAAYDSLQQLLAVPLQFTTAPQPVQYSLVDTVVKHSLH